MGWTHCDAAVNDDEVCPVCGIAKAAWTVQLEATRTFTIGRRARPKQTKSAWLEVALAGVAGAACEVELPDGQVVPRTLDEGGLLRLDELYPGDCKVRFTVARAWWSGAGEAEPTEEERRSHLADELGWIPCATGLRHRFDASPARLVDPEPAASPGVVATRRQWVNLEPAPDDPRDLGNRLKVRAAGVPGQPVFIRLDAGANNSKRDDPLPGIRGGEPGRRAAVELVGASGEVMFSVEVGLAGGDEHVIRVGSTPACADAAVKVVNWRRIRLQITSRAGVSLPGLELAHAPFARVFIELELAPPVVLEPGDERAPAGSWMDADMLRERPGKLLVWGQHNLEHFRALQPEADRDRRFAAHLVVVDETWDACESPRSLSDYALTYEQLLTAPPDAEDRVAFSGWKHRPKGSDGSFKPFPRRLRDGATSFISGSWTSEAPAGHPDHGRSGTLGPDDIDRFTSAGFSARLPGLRGIVEVGDGTPPPGRSAEDPATRHPVRVKVELSVLKAGPSGGQSWHRTLMVLLGERPPSKAEWTSIVLHELGHGLNQAGKSTPPGLGEPHAYTYTGKVGQSGPHCGFGLPDALIHAEQTGGHRGTCLMYGLVCDPPNLEFCEHCRPYVLGDAGYVGVEWFRNEVFPSGYPKELGPLERVAD
jgi:hypothetical protein